MNRWLWSLAGLLAFVGVWKWAQVSGVTAAGTMPDPWQVPSALADEFNSGRLIPALLSSLTHYFWGLGLGTLLGFSIGAFAATQRTFDHAHALLARILRPIPPLAWVVFAIAWFGVSHAGAAFVIAIGVFWVNYFATYSALKSNDPKYIEMARAFGHHGPWVQFFQVQLPEATPGIMAGVRTGVGQAWMTLIAAELLGVPGMGQEMNSAAGVGAYEAVVAYMLAISAVYSASDYFFSLAQRRVLAWRP